MNHIIIIGLLSLTFSGCEKKPYNQPESDSEDSKLEMEQGVAPPTPINPYAKKADEQTAKEVEEILDEQMQQKDKQPSTEQPAADIKNEDSNEPSTQAPAPPREIVQSGEPKQNSRPKSEGSADKSKQVEDKKGSSFSQGQRAERSNNIKQALEFYLTSCSQGLRNACHRYGWLQQSLGQLDSAMQFYDLACRRGLGKSCNNLGWLYENKGDYVNARSYYSWSCVKKHSKGCLNLARVKDMNPKPITNKSPKASSKQADKPSVKNIIEKSIPLMVH